MLSWPNTRAGTFPASEKEHYRTCSFESLWMRELLSGTFERWRRSPLGRESSELEDVCEEESGAKTFSI